MPKSLTAVSLLAFALGACTAVPPEPRRSATASGSRQCFFPQSINGFRKAPDLGPGRDAIYVDVGARDTYLFETFSSCPDLDYSEQIAFDNRPGGSICQGLDVDLIVPGPLGTRRCPVRLIRQLTPEERAARR